MKILPAPLLAAVISGSLTSLSITTHAAVITGVYHTQGTYKGKPYDHTGRFTDTWVFDMGKWQCVSSHTSLLKK